MNVLYNLLTTLSILEIPFLVDILNHKYISNAIFYHCYENNIAVGIQKIFHEHDFRVLMTKISDKYPYNYMQTKSVIVMDTACEEWTVALDYNEVLFQNYSVIIITEDLATTTNILTSYTIQVDSDVIVAHKTNSSIHLYEVYNTGYHYNGIFEIVNVGYWNSSLSIKDRFRKNLKGLKIKIATIILPRPKVVKETVEQHMEKPPSKVDTIHRMKFFILLKYMRDMYNISYDVHRTNSWGYQRNGTFDGMVGALHRGMADIGGAPLFFRSDRAENIHYISEVWMSRNSFIFRHPKHHGEFYTIYTRPLSNTVWCCVLALIVVTAVVIWFMLRMQADGVRSQDYSLSLASLVIWGALCQQAMYIRRESTSVKLATYVTFLYALTIYQYYNATIVSSLLMEEPKNIRTLQDLLDSDLKVGADDIVYNLDYFKRTTDPVAIKLYRRKVHTSTHYNFLQAADGMALVKKGGFAFHIDTVVAFPIIKETFQEREICETTLIQMYPLQKCGVVVRKKSPYKEYVTYGIRKMYEAGLLQRIQSVTDVSMPKCPHTPDSSVFCVDIREFSMPLLVLTFGIIMSLIIFLIEVIVGRRLKMRKRVKFQRYP